MSLIDKPCPVRRTVHDCRDREQWYALAAVSNGRCGYCAIRHLDCLPGLADSHTPLECSLKRLRQASLVYSRPSYSSTSSSTIPTCITWAPRGIFSSAALEGNCCLGGLSFSLSSGRCVHLSLYALCLYPNYSRARSCYQDNKLCRRSLTMGCAQ